MSGLDKIKKEMQTEIDKIKEDNKKRYAKSQVDKLLEHIEEVCDKAYDDLLAQDHKSFRRMWSFIMDKAKEYAIDNCAFVDDDTVYSWIDEYVKLDDKAKVEAEKKKKEKKNYTPVKTVETSTKEESKQISIFDMF